MADLTEEERGLAWIFGSSRSGSTWLLRMLGELPRAVPVDDPHLGHHLGVWRPLPLAWAASEEPVPELTTLLELKREEPGYFFSERHREAWWEPLRTLIAARFEAQRRDDRGRPTKPIYIIKEPGSHVAPLLRELFPRSRLIFLLRDGRDVVDSWLDAYSPGSWAIAGGAFPVARHGRLALIRWLASVWAYRTEAVLRAFEAHPRSHRVLVRYEQLRERPEDGLEAICGMLGLDPAPATAAAARHSFEALPAEARGPSQAARAARPGGWRENLTATEQAALHEALGETLLRAGYGAEDAPARPSSANEATASFSPPTGG